MKKNIIIGVLAMLCLIFSASAQPAPSLNALTIGDELPDITITDVVNAPSGSMRLHEYRGKILIIDFWATWCTACLLNYPKLEQVQQKFSGQVAVLGVTDQPKEKIRQFFASANGKKYRMVTATGDSRLSSLFPHRGIPHYIVIDQQGKVRAITDAEGVSEQNIQKLLSGQELQARVKKDLNADRPLFLEEAYPADHTIIKYSLLSKGYYSGLGSGNHLRKKGDKVIGQAVTNSHLLWLYETAAIHLFNQQGEQFSEKRMIVEVADPAAITLNPSPSGDGTYQTDNLYNFDLIVPESQAAQLYTIMINELNTLTAYSGRVEKRLIDCFVLRRIDSTDRLKTKGDKSRNTLFTVPPYELVNRPLRQLTIRLNDEKSVPLPVIDETHYSGKVDLSLPNTTEISEISNALNTYGLALVRERKELLMLIISDKNKP